MINKYQVNLLIDFLHDLRSDVKGKRIIFTLDFKNFLYPYHIVGISCAIEEYYLNECKIHIKEAAGSKMHKYWSDINFYSCWDHPENRKKYRNTSINTALCLWKISEEMIDSYTNYAQKYYEDNYLERKNLDALSISLAELFNNIFNHSESKVDGFTLTQYYPNKEKIIISVCDFGIGIPESINRFWKKEKGFVLTDPMAIQESLKKHVSARSTPKNKGFGLDTISTIVKALKGELTICSNKGLLIQHQNGLTTTSTLIKGFPGTLINIEFDIKNLPDKEEEELDYIDFSF